MAVPCAPRLKSASSYFVSSSSSYWQDHQEDEEDDGDDGQGGQVVFLDGGSASTSRNVTAIEGKEARLECTVRNLGNRTVGFGSKGEGEGGRHSLGVAAPSGNSFV